MADLEPIKTQAVEAFHKWTSGNKLDEEFAEEYDDYLKKLKAVDKITSVQAFFANLLKAAKAKQTNPDLSPEEMDLKLDDKIGFYKKIIEASKNDASIDKDIAKILAAAQKTEKDGGKDDKDDKDGWNMGGWFKPTNLIAMAGIALGGVLLSAMGVSLLAVVVLAVLAVGALILSQMLSAGEEENVTAPAAGAKPKPDPKPALGKAKKKAVSTPDADKPDDGKTAAAAAQPIDLVSEREEPEEGKPYSARVTLGTIKLNIKGEEFDYEVRTSGNVSGDRKKITFGDRVGLSSTTFVRDAEYFPHAYPSKLGKEFDITGGKIFIDPADRDAALKEIQIQAQKLIDDRAKAPKSAAEPKSTGKEFKINVKSTIEALDGKSGDEIIKQTYDAEYKPVGLESGKLIDWLKNTDYTATMSDPDNMTDANKKSDITRYLKRDNFDQKMPAVMLMLLKDAQFSPDGKTATVNTKLNATGRREDEYAISGKFEGLDTETISFKGGLKTANNSVGVQFEGKAENVPAGLVDELKNLKANPASLLDRPSGPEPKNPAEGKKPAAAAPTSVPADNEKTPMPLKLSLAQTAAALAVAKSAYDAVITPLAYARDNALAAIDIKNLIPAKGTDTSNKTEDVTLFYGGQANGEPQKAFAVFELKPIRNGQPVRHSVAVHGKMSPDGNTITFGENAIISPEDRGEGASWEYPNTLGKTFAVKDGKISIDKTKLAATLKKMQDKAQKLVDEKDKAEPDAEKKPAAEEKPAPADPSKQDITIEYVNGPRVLGTEQQVIAQLGTTNLAINGQNIPHALKVYGNISADGIVTFDDAAVDSKNAFAGINSTLAYPSKLGNGFAVTDGKISIDKAVFEQAYQQMRTEVDGIVKKETQAKPAPKEEPQAKLPEGVIDGSKLSEENRNMEIAKSRIALSKQFDEQSKKGDKELILKEVMRRGDEVTLIYVGPDASGKTATRTLQGKIEGNNFHLLSKFEEKNGIVKPVEFETQTEFGGVFKGGALDTETLKGFNGFLFHMKAINEREVQHGEKYVSAPLQTPKNLPDKKTGPQPFA